MRGPAPSAGTTASEAPSAGRRRPEARARPGTANQRPETRREKPRTTRTHPTLTTRRTSFRTTVLGLLFWSGEAFGPPAHALRARRPALHRRHRPGRRYDGPARHRAGRSHLEVRLARHLLRCRAQRGRAPHRAAGAHHGGTRRRPPRAGASRPPRRHTHDHRTAPPGPGARRRAGTALGGRARLRDRHPADTGPGRPRTVLHPVPAPAPPRRHGHPLDRTGHARGGPAFRRRRGVHHTAHPHLHDPHRTTHPAPLGGASGGHGAPGRSGARPARRAADPQGPRPGGRAGEAHRRAGTGLRHRHHAHPQDRLPVRCGPGVHHHAVGGDHRGAGGLPPAVRSYGPGHRPSGHHDRAGGVPAAAAVSTSTPRPTGSPPPTPSSRSSPHPRPSAARSPPPISARPSSRSRTWPSRRAAPGPPRD